MPIPSVALDVGLVVRSKRMFKKLFLLPIDTRDPPKSPLKRGTSGSCSPLFKGGWGGFRSQNEVRQTCVYTVALLKGGEGGSSMVCECYLKN